MLAGKMLIHACMLENKFVSHVPAYGMEMRGGSANCSLVISDKQVGSPMVKSPSAAILMSKSAYDLYEPQVAPGGVVVVNSDHVTRDPSRDDIKIIKLPCDTIAVDNGQSRSANVAALGGLLGAIGICQTESFKRVFEKVFKKKGQKAVDVNMRVLNAAIAHVESNNA